MKDDDQHLIWEAYHKKLTEDFSDGTPSGLTDREKYLAAKIAGEGGEGPLAGPHGPSQGHAYQEWQYMIVDTLGADEPVHEDPSLGLSAYTHVRQLGQELQGMRNIAAQRDKIETWAHKIVDSTGGMGYTDKQTANLHKFLDRFLTKVHMIADTNGDEAVTSELNTYREALDELREMSVDERYAVTGRSYSDQREDDKGEPKHPYDQQQKDYDAMDIDDPHHWQNSGAMPPGY